MITPLFIAFLGVLFSQSLIAEVTLQTKAEPFKWDAANDQGNWNAQNFKLNDPGFKRSGELLTNQVKLKTFSLIRDEVLPNSKATGNIWLAVLTHYNDLSTCVTHSIQPINVTNRPAGTVLTWSFDNTATLSSNKTYFYTVYEDNGNGKFDTNGSDQLTQVRVETHSSSIVDGFTYPTKSQKNLVTRVTVDNTETTDLSAVISIGGITLALVP